MKALLSAALVSLAVIVTVEIAYRSTHGTPGTPFGQTTIEFQWKVRHVPEDAEVVYVIGDSRVEWGFAELLFNEEMQRRGLELRGVNAGSAGASVSEIIRTLTAMHPGKPGAMIVNFSPCGFYRFALSPGPPLKDLKLQDLIDDSINNYVRQRIWTWGRRPQVLVRHAVAVASGTVPREVAWERREWMPQGTVKLTGRYNDGAPFDVRSYEVGEYRKMYAKMPHERALAAQRQIQLAEALEGARKAGWRIVFIRMPVGEGVWRMESTLPEEFQLRTTAAKHNIPAIDYQDDPRVRDLQTVDDSHLTPESARKMTAVLAEDVYAVLRKQQGPKPPQVD